MVELIHHGVYLHVEGVGVLRGRDQGTAHSFVESLRRLIFLTIFVDFHIELHSLLSVWRRRVKEEKLQRLHHAQGQSSFEGLVEALRREVLYHDLLHIAIVCRSTLSFLTVFLLLVAHLVLLIFQIYYKLLNRHWQLIKNMTDVDSFCELKFLSN